MKQLVNAILLALLSCGRHTADNAPASLSLRFLPPVKVTVAGYNQDIMEPFLSKDGKYLFFNNLNNPAVNTNLYYAEKVNDSTFTYIGEIGGVNSAALDAVATMDSTGNFYFVSVRSYAQTLSTVYSGVFSGGTVSNAALLPGISENKPGQVEFDVEVTSDGRSLYFSEGQYTPSGELQAADIGIAVKEAAGFSRLAGSAGLLRNVNTSQLEYAACISPDEKILYFTRVPAITAFATPRIFYATRESRDVPFHTPQEIALPDGFVEAPSLSADGKLLYYHKKENNHFVLYYSGMY